MLSLLDLPWADILCKKIFPYLRIEEVYRLKHVSKQSSEVMELFVFNYCNHLDFSAVGRKRTFTSHVFGSITSPKQNIKHLNLKNCQHWLSDEHLIPVLKQNVNITSLYAPDCYRLRDATFVCLGDVLKNLRNLDLSYCRELSNDAVVSIGGNLHGLIALTLTSCSLVNDSGIKAIALNNNELEVLCTRQCYSLTDACITVVARNCLNLRVLDISGCWRVKDSSIIAVREYCRCLQELYVKDCTGVTEISLARLRPAGVKVDVVCPPYRPGESLALVKLPMLQI